MLLAFRLEFVATLSGQGCPGGSVAASAIRLGERWGKDGEDVSALSTSVWFAVSVNLKRLSTEINLVR